MFDWLAFGTWDCIPQETKTGLRETIVTLRAQGLSYREIGRAVGLH
jgi:hypothetical protein